ncbi:MAG: Uma2 family endonuclease [Acetobacteraceae bacterium]
MAKAARKPAMNVALRTRRMTRGEFFDWAQAQPARFEFDGFQPVAMTGGTFGHDQITANLRDALRARLRGSGCRAAGPNAGLATIGDAVRYPDALITCSKVRDDDYLVPGVVVVFEVVSKTSGGTDRVTKLREYQAVPSILRYVIVEQSVIGLSVFERSQGDASWTASGLIGGETLRIPEVGIEIPIEEFYTGTELVAAADEAVEEPGKEQR